MACSGEMILCEACGCRHPADFACDAVCDCQAPIVESGAALVSESCPIHAPQFLVCETMGRMSKS